MKRDGATISLWQSGMPAFTETNRSLPSGSVDVAIIAGGITGLATGYLLQKKGRN
jgi:hypothetical protein